jgi:hypothetical protein
MTIKEIAEQFGIAEKTVQYYIQQACEKHAWVSVRIAEAHASKPLEFTEIEAADIIGYYLVDKGICISEDGKMTAKTMSLELRQQFYSLKQAWEIKGGCAWGTFRSSRYLQPKGGHYDGYFGGKGVFFFDTIQEWLPLTDAELVAYHERYLTGAKPVSRIKTITPLVAV